MQLLQTWGHTLGDFPEAEWVGNNGVHIGCHQYLSEDDVAKNLYCYTEGNLWRELK